jgi:hypothetical protein
MTGPEGVLFLQDADSEGEEGKFLSGQRSNQGSIGERSTPFSAYYGDPPGILKEDQVF